MVSVGFTMAEFILEILYFTVESFAVKLKPPSRREVAIGVVMIASLVLLALAI